jgi:hypothetical protein
MKRKVIPVRIFGGGELYIGRRKRERLSYLRGEQPGTTMESKVNSP